MRIVDPDALPAALPGLPASPRVVTSGNFATPRTALAALDAGIETYRLNLLNAQVPLPDRDGVIWETSFVGAAMRRSPRLAYVPTRLSLVPDLWRTTLPPDVVVVHTSTPRGGQVSLGIEVNVLPSAIEAVRARGGVLIAQMNPRMPFTRGDGVLDVDDVDLAVEVDEPLASPPPIPLDDTAAAIGAAVAGRVPDGATVQLGIGAVPDAVLHGLRSRRGLRVWSEMFSDGVLALDAEGALDTDATITASFAFGSAELYRWIDGNDRVQMLRTEVVNEPARIARNPRMVSVNTALQVDLFAQANASRIGSRIFSGFGGQTDFIVGALHSPGGQAIMALRSWHPKADVSTIVPLVDEPVTSFQPTAVVTEQGVADVFGHDERTQAAHLIEQAAHPRVRDELWEEAAALGLLG
ncbi:acetyl-CoA hydrolase/transferase C-terminal domain-containing protein [Euzebya sp.]|uniref:acetyl-CoA hydrolase/transferase C-terminal domain-containing protein n=1 Tax=Euzebya sp. TaxID=1971409 RepID=UPI003515047D